MTEATQEGNGSSKPAKAKAEVEKVRMEDGREVEFVGKRKMLKDILIGGTPIDEADADTVNAASVDDIAVRLDFRNGTSRTYPLNPALGIRFAGHGALQKYGDELAGEDSADLDDWAATTDRLHDRLTAGEWTKGRDTDSMAGTSVLIRALVETSGKTKEAIREFLKSKTAAQKKAMLRSDRLRPIVERLEAEAAARAEHVNTDELFGQLDAATT